MLKKALTQRFFGTKACRHFIDGKWVSGSGKDTIKILNPVCAILTPRPPKNR